MRNMMVCVCPPFIDRKAPKVRGMLARKKVTEVMERLKLTILDPAVVLLDHSQ